jgi:hypothetical protein
VNPTEFLESLTAKADQLFDSPLPICGHELLNIRESLKDSREAG